MHRGRKVVLFRGAELRCRCVLCVRAREAARKEPVGIVPGPGGRDRETPIGAVRSSIVLFVSLVRLIGKL